MKFNNVQELIVRLKTIKKKTGISYARIMDLMKENGDYVSLSTLKRVFAPGSENESFNYINTILPIARALDCLCEHGDVSTMQETINELNKQLSFLRHQLELKDEIIEKLMERL